MDAPLRSWQPLARLTAWMSGAPQTKTRRAIVSTEVILPASSVIVWTALVFYEEVTHRPPLLLQGLLPDPVRSEGDKGKVGSILRCAFRGARLLENNDTVDEGRVVDFDIF